MKTPLISILLASLLVPASIGAQAPAKAAKAAKKQTFRHASGFFFHYPAAWKTRAISEGVLVLTPKDADPDGELMLVLGDDAGGLTKASDPRAVRALDNIVRSILPKLKRTGKPEDQRLGNRIATTLRWHGNGNNGRAIRAKLRVTILEGRAVGVLLVGDDKRFPMREPKTDAIFASFGFTKPKGDPRVVGTWRYDVSYVSGDFTAASSTYLVLAADGTCRIGGTRMGMGSDAGSGMTGRGGYTAGTWHTEGKVIQLRWKDGSSESWRFYVSADSMLFKNSPRSKKLWKRCR